MRIFPTPCCAEPHLARLGLTADADNSQDFLRSRVKEALSKSEIPFTTLFKSIAVRCRRAGLRVEFAVATHAEQPMGRSCRTQLVALELVGWQDDGVGATQRTALAKPVW
jgi:hypothetical protein